MYRTTTDHSRQVRRRMAASIIAFTASIGALGPSASAHATDAATCSIRSTFEQIEARRELRRVVDKMPVGWRVTEVMRRHLDEQLDADRACARRIVELMPAGWPATEAMRRELES